MNEPKIHGIYRHYKGNLYIVEDIATHGETEEKLVIYRALYGDNHLWARPYDMFIDQITIDGKPVKRFEAITIESFTAQK